MKRILDVCFAITGLVVLAPAGLFVALGIWLTSPGPVLFRQERLGRGGMRFSIYKFRTMTVQKSGGGCLVTAGGDVRITSFGHFLRRHKLDELPQLINVLLGDMSFVGPRPEVPEFAELFPMEYARILKVRPGITHPATLRFRREETILAVAPDPRRFYIEKVMPEKLAAYEEELERSLAADIRTIVGTILPDLAPGWIEAPYGPEHFASAPARQPAATVDDLTIVKNIPTIAEQEPAPVPGPVLQEQREVAAV